MEEVQAYGYGLRRFFTYRKVRLGEGFNRHKHEEHISLITNFLIFIMFL